MTKHQFVQRTAPLMLLAQIIKGEGKADPARAIAWAETLWERLTQAGYGPQTSAGPRDLKDHVAALTPELGASFGRLWRAYALPKGKQPAAARWAQIAPSAALAEVIIAAAEADSREPRAEGAERKWLQGWLSERRWEDRPAKPSGSASPGASQGPPPGALGYRTSLSITDPTDDVEARRLAVADLVGERARLALLLRVDPADQAARDQIAEIDARLRTYGLDPGAKTAPKRSGPSPVAHLLRPPRPPEDT